MGDQISASTAARMAGCSHSTVRRWIHEGLIPQVVKGKRGWLIDADQFRLFLATGVQPQSGHSQRVVEQSVDREHLQLLTEQLKKSESRCDMLESENRKLNAEIRALLAQKVDKGMGSVLSRWIRF